MFGRGRRFVPRLEVGIRIVVVAAVIGVWIRGCLGCRLIDGIAIAIAVADGITMCLVMFIDSIATNVSGRSNDIHSAVIVSVIGSISPHSCH